MTTPDCRLVVRELWRYPVKSIGGEQLTGCDVYETGFEGDRGWGVVDVATGTVLTARRAPELLFASARLRDGGEVEIQLPDGQVTDSSAVLSAWLQRDVRLDRASDEGGVYENPRKAEGVPPTAVAPVPDVPDGDELLSVVLMVDLVVEVVVSVEVFVGTGRSTRGGFVPHASTARWASRRGRLRPHPRRLQRRAVLGEFGFRNVCRFQPRSRKPISR